MKPFLEELKEAWFLFKGRFWLFVGIMFAFNLAVFVLALPAGAVIGGFELKDWTPGSIAAGAFIGIVSAVGALWAQAALLVAVASGKGSVGIFDAYRRALPYFLPLLAVMVLTMLAVIGGLVLLIVPGVIFSVWFMFASYVVVFENIKGWAACNRSREYVRGRWWDVFLRVLGFVSLVIVVSAVLGALSALLGLSRDFGSMLFSLVITPLSTIYFYVLYKELKETIHEPPLRGTATEPVLAPQPPPEPSGV